MHPGTSSTTRLRIAGALVALVWGALPCVVPRVRAQDARSVELLRYGCASATGRREVTLFANGTVRLREGPWDHPRLYLDELGPEALADKLRVLRSVYSANELDRLREPIGRGPTGSGIEHCEVFLALPELEEPLTYRYTSYDVPPLRLSRIVHVADELAEYARPVEREQRLPADYEPRTGDVLRTAEGNLFEVLRRTADGRGVELQGVEQPLRLFVALDDLATAFVAIEERQSATWWRQR